MRPPIVIDEHGDISLSPSVEAAARYIEPIDVRNNEYVVYDSTGYLLQLVPTEPVVSIPDYRSELPQEDQLEQALRSWSVSLAPQFQWRQHRLMGYLHIAFASSATRVSPNNSFKPKLLRGSA